MTVPPPLPPERRPVPRVVVMLPTGFTLATLFFGIFAIVSAARGEYVEAGRWIVFGGICDALDGRVARATRSGSRFGEELDSLVDAISFGLAPALLVYFAVLNRAGWDWVFVFLYSACAVLRLARFNVEQAGRKKTHFTGLPSPAAGGTLATYYWFSQTPLYYETIIGDLPWQVVMRWLMAGLGFLMISNVQYAAAPLVGFRSWRHVVGTGMVVATFFGVLFLPKEFFFPAAMLYILWGLARTVVLGLLDRLPDDATGEALDERRRRRRRRDGIPTPPPPRSIAPEDPAR
ncbi:MAG: CDP-diacylglycerol--serine O-phosphatidyltransferase [Gemmatimonadota bacterium]